MSTLVQIAVAEKIRISSVNFFLQNYPAKLPSFFMEMAIMYFTWLYFYETKSAWNEAVCLFSDLQNNNGKVIMCFYSKEVQLSAKFVFQCQMQCFSYFMVWNEVRWEWEVVTVIISLTAFESHFDPRRIKNDPRKLADQGIKKALGTIPKFHFGSVSLIQGVSWSTKSL